MHIVKKYLSEDRHDITIILIGAGGSGSFMLSNLARINYALMMMGRKGIHVTTVDFDDVSEFNVGRQLFAPSDIGQNKARVLTERINRAYGTSWCWSGEQVNRTMKGIKGNIIITCVDNVKARRTVKKLFANRIPCAPYEQNLYWLDMGNGKDFGQVVLSDMEELPNIFDMHGDIRESKADGPSCSMAESLNRQSLFINSTLTQYAGNILFELLTKEKLEYHGVYLNLKTMQTKPIPCRYTKQ